MENLNLDDIKFMFDLTPEEQVNYLKEKGVEVSDNWKETAEIVNRHAFTVAKVASAEMLMEFKTALEEAIANGDTQEEFAKNIRKRLEQKGWLGNGEKTPYRLGLIYRMNIQSAYVDGRWRQMQASADLLPYILSIAANEGSDKRVTPNCKHLHLKAFSKYDPYYRKNLRVPRHFLCRSREVSLTQARLEAMGLKVSQGKDFAAYKNAPGFIRPNDVWQPDLTKFPDELREQLANELEENGNG